MPPVCTASFRTQAVSILLIFFLPWIPRPLLAADWEMLTQPIGTPNTPFLVDPASINSTYPAGQGPWDGDTMVTSISTTAPQFFVRFYNPTAPVNASGQEGGWIMRATEVRGLTAGKARDKFALPNLPTMMTLGVTNPGETLYTGIAAQIEGWGAGGGQQSQQTGVPYTTFFNGQPIIEPILDYTAMAGTKNGQSVAAYLMGHIPEPYSDMETVYNSLDVLWNPATRTLFDAALASISPERFDDLVAQGFDAAMLHQRTIVGRLDPLRPRTASATRAWAQVLWPQGRHAGVGYENDFFGIAAGIDYPAAGWGRYGYSLAWIRGTLAWDNGGEATCNYYRGALYAAVMGNPAFLQLILSGGASSQRVDRVVGIGTFYQHSPHGPDESMLIPVFRRAASSAAWWDADITFRGGVSSGVGPLRLRPAAEAGFLRQSRGAFREHGAGSLDLLVSAAHATTFHAGAELRMEYPVHHRVEHRIAPYMTLGWNYLARMDNTTVTAALNEWPETFTVTARDTGRHSIVEALGITVALEQGASFFTEAFHERGGNDTNLGLRTGIAW